MIDVGGKFVVTANDFLDATLSSRRNPNTGDSNMTISALTGNAGHITVSMIKDGVPFDLSLAARQARLAGELMVLYSKTTFTTGCSGIQGFDETNSIAASLDSLGIDSVGSDFDFSISTNSSILLGVTHTERLEMAHTTEYNEDCRMVVTSQFTPPMATIYGSSESANYLKYEGAEGTCSCSRTLAISTEPITDSTPYTIDGQDLAVYQFSKGEFRPEETLSQWANGKLDDNWQMDEDTFMEMKWTLGPSGRVDVTGPNIDQLFVETVNALDDRLGWDFDDYWFGCTNETFTVTSLGALRFSPVLIAKANGEYNGACLSKDVNFYAAAQN